MGQGPEMILLVKEASFHQQTLAKILSSFMFSAFFPCIWRTEFSINYSTGAKNHLEYLSVLNETAAVWLRGKMDLIIFFFLFGLEYSFVMTKRRTK